MAEHFGARSRRDGRHFARPRDAISNCVRSRRTPACVVFIWRLRFADPNVHLDIKISRNTDAEMFPWEGLFK